MDQKIKKLQDKSDLDYDEAQLALKLSNNKLEFALKNAEDIKEKLEIIQQTMEITKQEASIALKLAAGDLNEALQMSDYVDKNYIVIQGKFIYNNNQQSYGLFSLIGDGKEGEFIKINCILTSEKMTDINLKVNNKIFTKTLKEMSKSEIKSSKIKQLKSALYNFYPSEIFELLNLIRNNKQNKVKIILIKTLNDILEKQVELNISCNLITKAKLARFYPNLFKKETIVDEKKDFSSKNKNDEVHFQIQLNCIPIISPTKGIKINNLQPGDDLPVKISDHREIGKYFKQLLQDDTGLATGVIEEIEVNKESKRYRMLIKFGPHVYGNIIVEREIKLITSHSQIQQEDSKESIIKRISKDKFNYTFIGLIGVIIILIVISLYLS